MHPLIGGIFPAAVHSTCRSALKSDISHRGASIFTPDVVILSMNIFADLEVEPALDNSRRFFAPLVAIYLAMLLPCPPSPPEITYVAVVLNS
jgi:hypothetical protein